MSVPYLGGAMKGWTSKKKFKVIRKEIVNHRSVSKETPRYESINWQPVPSWKVDKKPEGQRTWRWFSIIVTGKRALGFKEDDIVILDNMRFKIMSGADWSQSGFQKYEAIEDFTSE